MCCVSLLEAGLVDGRDVIGRRWRRKRRCKIPLLSMVVCLMLCELLLRAHRPSTCKVICDC